jgi:hypothetical protein
MRTWLTCLLCTQARSQGTLDAQVVSLEARRELIRSLDLVPARFSYEAAAQAVGPPPPPAPTGAAQAALMATDATSVEAPDASDTVVAQLISEVVEEFLGA